VKYAEVGEVDYGYYDPDGDTVFGFVTEPVGRGTTFGEAVARLVLSENGRSEYDRVGTVLMTTRKHWSGYSEYTIMDEWSEIILTVPELEWEKEWPSLGDFLRAMAEANPEAGN
jgi:hypothetical protein